MELVKILTIFTLLDFSCNNFVGPIRGEIGELKSPCVLNLSHNAFTGLIPQSLGKLSNLELLDLSRNELTGEIPQSLGKLSNLELLDLSRNELTGEIPFQLPKGLLFLSILNLSFNLLEGMTPHKNQFDTFANTSYNGNIGLCGSPMEEKCIHEESRSSPSTSEETHAIYWKIIIVELGFIFGFGIVIKPLMLWKRWRICYSNHTDDIFFKMFPQFYIRMENRLRLRHRNQRRRAHRNQGRRH